MLCSRRWRWGSAFASAPSFSLWLLWLAICCPLGHLRAFWRFEWGQCVSILLLITRWNNLPMIGPTVIGLKSPGLSVPWLNCSLFFWNTSNNSCFERIWGTPTEQPKCHMGGHVFWSYFVQVTFFHSVKTRSRILQVLQGLNDFIGRDRNITGLITFRLLDEDLFPIFE